MNHSIKRQEIARLENELLDLHNTRDLHAAVCVEINFAGTKPLRWEEYEESSKRVDEIQEIEIPRIEAEIEKLKISL